MFIGILVPKSIYKSRLPPRHIWSHSRCTIFSENLDSPTCTGNWRSIFNPYAIRSYNFQNNIFCTGNWRSIFNPYAIRSYNFKNNNFCPTVQSWVNHMNYFIYLQITMIQISKNYL